MKSASAGGACAALLFEVCLFLACLWVPDIVPLAWGPFLIVLLVYVGWCVVDWCKHKTHRWQLANRVGMIPVDIALMLALGSGFVEEEPEISSSPSLEDSENDEDGQ